MWRRSRVEDQGGKSFGAKRGRSMEAGKTFSPVVHAHANLPITLPPRQSFTDSCTLLNVHTLVLTKHLGLVFELRLRGVAVAAAAAPVTAGGGGDCRLGRCRCRGERGLLLEPVNLSCRAAGGAERGGGGRGRGRGGGGQAEEVLGEIVRGGHVAHGVVGEQGADVLSHTEARVDSKNRR